MPSIAARRWPVRTARLAGREGAKERALAAYHEAAHAVVAMANGLDVTMATIAPRRGDLGHVAIEMPSPEVCKGVAPPRGLSRAARREWTRAWRTATVSCAQVYMAGLAAESLLREELAIPTNDPDYVGASQYVAAFCHRFGAREDATDVFHAIWKATQQMLRRGWETVERIAKALLANTTLRWGRREPLGSRKRARLSPSARTASCRKR